MSAPCNRTTPLPAPDLVVWCHENPWQAAKEIERLRAALQHIAHMECFTRDGEEEPHLLMMRLAQETLNV